MSCSFGVFSLEFLVRVRVWVLNKRSSLMSTILCFIWLYYISYKVTEGKLGTERTCLTLVSQGMTLVLDSTTWHFAPLKGRRGVNISWKPLKTVFCVLCIFIFWRHFGHQKWTKIEMLIVNWIIYQTIPNNWVFIYLNMIK